jgi:diaminopimelate decarboxylase
MRQFTFRDGEPLVDGLSLWQVAAIASRTPFYVYSVAGIVERIAAIRSAIPRGLQLHYAIKANPMPALVHRLAPLVDGLDVASLGELQLALTTGIAPAAISIAGPGKQDHELTAAIAAGVVINVESAGELQRLEQIQTESGSIARIALRVNPDFHLRGSGMAMGGGSQQFGIDAERIGEVIGASRLSRLVGLHIFAGSQNLAPAALQQGLSHTFKLATRIVDDLGLDLQHLNIGGGLGIPYFPADHPLDLAAYGNCLATEAAAWHERFPNCQLILELGRFLVGEAGLFVSRVIDRKESRGKTFLVVDGGLHHHLAASGNFGQRLPRNYPISAVTRVVSSSTEVVTIVGPLCTPLDALGRDVVLPVCDVGDLIVIYQSGAYGLTASPLQFLGHPAPVELLL